MLLITSESILSIYNVYIVDEGLCTWLKTSCNQLSLILLSKINSKIILVHCTGCAQHQAMYMDSTVSCWVLTHVLDIV